LIDTVLDSAVEPKVLLYKIFLDIPPSTLSEFRDEQNLLDLRVKKICAAFFIDSPVKRKDKEKVLAMRRNTTIVEAVCRLQEQLQLAAAMFDTFF
jgi:hypothetical protein